MGPLAGGHVEINLDSLVIRIGLGTREQRALRKLGVQTVAQFLKLNIARARRISGCGAVTCEHLAAARRRLRRRLSARPAATPKLDMKKPAAPPAAPAGPSRTRADSCRTPDQAQLAVSLAEPASPAKLAKLPLFTSSPPCGLSPADLHPGYHPSLPLSHASLPPQAAAKLARHGIATIGSLLMTPGAALLDQTGLDLTELTLVRLALRSILFPRGRQPHDVDFASFDAMATTFVKSAVADGRNALIVIDRLGLAGEPRTYDEIGRLHNVTRERIHQIVQRETRRLRLPARLLLLERLWAVLDTTLERSGNPVPLPEFCSTLVERFHWQPPPAALLGEILALNPAYSVDREIGWVARHDFRCPACPTPREAFRRIFRGTAAEVHIAEVCRLLAEGCAAGCTLPQPELRAMKPVFVDYLIRNVPGVAVRDADCVYHPDRWALCCSPKLRNVIVSAMKTLHRPAHYSEVSEVIRREHQSFRNVSDSHVLDRLWMCREFRRVGRGTYALASWKHKPYRTCTEAVIELLEQQGSMRGREIVSRLSRGSRREAINIRSALRTNRHIRKTGPDTYALAD